MSPKGGSEYVLGYLFTGAFPSDAHSWLFSRIEYLLDFSKYPDRLPHCINCGFYTTKAHTSNNLSQIRLPCIRVVAPVTQHETMVYWPRKHILSCAQSHFPIFSKNVYFKAGILHLCLSCNCCANIDHAVWLKIFFFLTYVHNFVPFLTPLISY